MGFQYHDLEQCEIKPICSKWLFEVISREKL
jgi:hypothetical protein